MKDYKVGGRGHSSGGSIFPALLAALAGAPSPAKSGTQAKPNTDNTQTTPAYDDSGNVIGNQNNVQSTGVMPTLAKPSTFQSLVNPALLQQYYGFQGQQALSGQQAQQAKELQAAVAAIATNKDFRDQALAMATSMHVPVADDNALTQFAATTFHPAVINAAAQQGVQATQLATGQATASAQQRMAESPTGQEAAGQNYLAGENEQGVRNEAMIPDTGPFGLRYGNLGPGQGTLNVAGFQPGSASTKQNTFTMKNGLPVQTETSTTTPTVSGGSGSVIQNLTPEDMATLHNSFLEQQQQNGGAPASNSASPPTNPPITLAKPPTQMGGSFGVQAPMNPMFQLPLSMQPVATKPPVDNSATMQLLQMFQQAGQGQTNNAAQGQVNPQGMGLPDWMRLLQGTQQ